MASKSNKRLKMRNRKEKEEQALKMMGYLDIKPASAVITPSEKMFKLLEELKYHVHKSGELLLTIYEQGKADGLDNKEIRKLVNASLRGVLSERLIILLKILAGRGFLSKIAKYEYIGKRKILHKL